MRPSARLFAPVQLGPRELTSRLVMLPLETLFSPTGGPNARDLAFYRERAGSELGAIITGGTAAHPSSLVPGRNLLRAYEPEQVPSFAKLARVVHHRGSLIFGQLTHRGRDPLSGPLSTSSWGPSATASYRIPQIPHAMTVDEIEAVIASFAAGARNLLAAGYDGIEIHAAHGYLAGQFLSPLTNARKDAYGGSLTRRMRFLIELCKAVRAATAGNIVLGLRLSASEEVSGGITFEDVRRVVREVDRCSPVDYLSLTVGTRGACVRDMATPPGVLREAGKALRDRTRTPLLLAQRITTPELAEQLIREGAADLVGVARALIADADFARKARRGEGHRIRPCVGCLQDCRSRTHGVGCVHNPAAGAETTIARPRPRVPQRRVVVIGGGPAGLEAALIASGRGHRVTLLEARDRLGGQVTTASRAPNRRELEGIITWRYAELARLQVEVRTGVRAGVDDVLGLEPDHVILATGSVAVLPSLGRPRGTKVRTCQAVLDGIALEAVARAVVADNGSGTWEALGAVEWLAERGVRVQFVTPARAIAENVPSESVTFLLQRLAKAKVTLLTLTRPVELIAGGLAVEDVAGGRRRVLAADLVALHGGRRPDDVLARDLKAAAGGSLAVVAVGDCRSARDLGTAIREAREAALAI